MTPHFFFLMYTASPALHCRGADSCISKLLDIYSSFHSNCGTASPQNVLLENRNPNQVAGIKWSGHLSSQILCFHAHKLL